MDKLREAINRVAKEGEGKLTVQNVREELKARGDDEQYDDELIQQALDFKRQQIEQMRDKTGG